MLLVIFEGHQRRRFDGCIYSIFLFGRLFICYSKVSNNDAIGDNYEKFVKAILKAMIKRNCMPYVAGWFIHMVNQEAWNLQI